MAKKALCVGINKYPFIDGKDLKGCVNDALAWADLLTNHYNFLKEDVVLLLDEQATKVNMVEGLKKLLTGVHGGDVLVFTNSSHGTYVIDKDDDEPSTEWIGQYDQAICPHDCKNKDSLLLDDEIRKLLADLPADVHMTVISDSCHSASVTRLTLSFDDTPTPDDRRHRLLPPHLMGCREFDSARADKSISSIAKKSKYPESQMKEILLSGCDRMQSSIDARIKGTYHGAMTYFALQAIVEANYNLTYKQLHKRLCSSLVEAQYPQNPQLEGSKDNKNRQLFT